MGVVHCSAVLYSYFILLAVLVSLGAFVQFDRFGEHP